MNNQDDTQIITREYKSSDEEQIINLLDLVFDGWPKFNLDCTKQEHWDWKYQNNYIDKKVIAVNDLNGRIVGASHICIFKIKIYEDTILTGVGGDVFVHPDFQGKGLHREKTIFLIELKKRAKIDFIYAITNNPIVISMFKRNPRYKRFPIDLTHYVRIHDIDKHMQYNDVEREWITKIGIQVFKLLGQIQTRNKALEQTNVKVTRVDAFDERINGFWEKLKSRYDVIVESDRKYLNWRYATSGAGPFTIFLAEEESEIVGFIVIRVNHYRPEYPEGSVMELLVDSGRSDAVYELMKAAMDVFDGEGVNIVHCLRVQDYEYDSVLKEFGFIDSLRNHHIYMNTEPNGLPHYEKIKTTQISRIHFSYGNLV